MGNEVHTLDEAPQGLDAVLPTVVDHVALARLYGEPLFAMPRDLYIPPDALQIFLEAFEGPLDLLLYLIRKQNFNILDIPMAAVTRQYLTYVDEIRNSNLELAAEYLLMAAMLIEIKSRMLLPPKKTAEGEEAEDPRAELVRRLLEYEQMKLAGARLDQLPLLGRDFLRVQVHSDPSIVVRHPDVTLVDLREAWLDILKRAKLHTHHTITREELSVREHMGIVLRGLQGKRFVEFEHLDRARLTAFPEPRFERDRVHRNEGEHQLLHLAGGAEQADVRAAPAHDGEVGDVGPQQRPHEHLREMGAGVQEQARHVQGRVARARDLQDGLWTGAARVGDARLADVKRAMQAGRTALLKCHEPSL